MTEFAGRLKQLREQRQLSLQDVAKRLLVQTDEVQKWENGEILPDTLTMMKLSEMFGVSLDYLIRGEETAEIVYSEKDARQEFTDGDVYRIAYRYLLLKMRLKHACFVFPIGLAVGLFALIPGIILNVPALYGVGIFITAFDLVMAIFGGSLLFRTYKREEKRLEEKYGKELMQRATIKLLFRFDKSLYEDRDKPQNKH